ncbi:Gar1/Naf1 RNA binding region-domain-containing protein [Trametes punicea]|nr:Gar1/Naf1 RNA binding region-domain-containing protein [Trametes punicea]
MSAAFSFAVPSAIAQDIQLIQEIVGDLPPPPPRKASQQNVYSDRDHDHGTDSDTDSEREVEADILGGLQDEDDEMAREMNAPPSHTSESSSDSDSDSSSSSDADSEEEPTSRRTTQKPAHADVEDDDDEADAGGPAEALVRTKNEVVDVDIMIPDVSEVGPHEELEKVGEVMSIVDKVVIIKGIPSGIANRGSEKALDSDTLLVFEDRKVLGYIYETFGPTNEPLYQVRFNQRYPLDTEKVQIGRTVYHVPEKSNYVFVRQLRQYKGSDASNVHDEEPAEDELEFSDDEQELAHRRALAQRREQSRARSVASSRQTTPLPSRMRDQDMVDDPYGGSSYQQSLSYNDMDFGAGPSRPPPMPYDDPYSDSYGAAPPSDAKSSAASVDPPRDASPLPRAPMRGRSGAQRRDDNGRGRGRGRWQNERGRSRGRGRGRGGGVDSRGQTDGPGSEGASSSEYHPRGPRSSSPTSLAIARATGQYGGGHQFEATVHDQMLQGGGGGSWGVSQLPVQSYDFSFGYQYPQYPPVQPHINPRFASNFGMAGMGMGYTYDGQPAPYSPDAGYSMSGYGSGGGGWSNEWAPPSQRNAGGNQSDKSDNA